MYVKILNFDLNLDTSLEPKPIHIYVYIRCNNYKWNVIVGSKRLCQKHRCSRKIKARLLAVKTLYTALILFSIISSQISLRSWMDCCMHVYSITEFHFFIQLPIHTHIAKPNYMGYYRKLHSTWFIPIWLNQTIWEIHSLVSQVTCVTDLPDNHFLYI